MSSYSPIFIHNLKLRATAHLAKSMSLTSSNTHNLLHNRFHFSGQNSVFFRHNPSPNHYVLRKKTGLAFNNFACLAAGSSSSSPSSVLKLIRKHASSSSSLSKLPHFYQQRSGYGRFAYDDYVSEDDDYESDNNGSSQQMVSFLFKGCFVQMALWE